MARGALDRELVGLPVVSGGGLEVQPGVLALGLGRRVLEVGDQLRALVGRIGLQGVTPRGHRQLEGVAGDGGRVAVGLQRDGGLGLARPVEVLGQRPVDGGVALGEGGLLGGAVLLEDRLRAPGVDASRQAPLRLRVGIVEGGGTHRLRRGQTLGALGAGRGDLGRIVARAARACARSASSAVSCSEVTSGSARKAGTAATGRAWAPVSRAADKPKPAILCCS